MPAVPEATPLEAAAEVTDAMNEAAALIVSCGPEGLKAAKTVCSVVSNVLKAPKEAKYRQLNWYDTRYFACRTSLRDLVVSRVRCCLQHTCVVASDTGVPEASSPQCQRDSLACRRRALKSSVPCDCSVGVLFAGRMKSEQDGTAHTSCSQIPCVIA